MTETILPHELPNALERAPAGIKVLSLDCFDTLLWRDCHGPSDVFSGLSAVYPAQRVLGEANARKAERTRRRRNEVGLGAIYAQAMPGAERAAIEAAAAEECALEAASCFAFAPTVELMREAKARGLKVIIVSDTYLDVAALTRLIRDAAGDEVAGLIDRVFASSDAGISKSEGLLAKALKAMKCRPQHVLHIGDNPKADYESARALGVPALHLMQFSETARQRLRLERASQSVGMPTRPGNDGSRRINGVQAHRAVLAHHEPQIDDPALALGFSVLGPVFHAFENWLRDQAARLETERGGKVHWLFMLRDGHLPFLVHCERGKAASAARVEISRYAATASALTTHEAYERHLWLESRLNPATLARQMLFTDDEIERHVGKPRSDVELAAASERLLAELRSGKREKTTRRRSRDYADRMIAHVRANVDPDPGDTLMLVDLGYNGSAQNQIDAVLSEAFDCHIAGRYLLLREMKASGLDKAGLIDVDHFDSGLLDAMCATVAVIEQLATCELGSVTDYSPEGEPIRKPVGVKGRQSDIRDKVQSGIVAFAKAALDPPVIREREPDAARVWRESAAGALTRFMFLPQPCELDVLESFEHDVNLGSELIVPLFDTAFAEEGLRRRGLFYMKGSARMFLPAELAHEDIATRFSLLLQRRFGLSLTYTDHAPRTIPLRVLYAGKDDQSARTVEARATHDGYFSAHLPVSSMPSGISIVLGQDFEWIEIASVTRSSIETLRGGLENDDRPEQLTVLPDGLIEHAQGIFECESVEGLLFIPPDQLVPRETPDMVEIVLRPLRKRAQRAAQSDQQILNEVAA